jgi:hypothetical protein
MLGAFSSLPTQSFGHAIEHHPWYTPLVGISNASL